MCRRSGGGQYAVAIYHYARVLAFAGIAAAAQQTGAFDRVGRLQQLAEQEMALLEVKYMTCQQAQGNSHSDKMM